MIVNKLQLVENILVEISDNSTGKISPYDIRHNLLDIVDSVHLLLDNQHIQTANFASFQNRSTKAGDNIFSNSHINGYLGEDNSAFGFEALKSNYQGTRNTSVGSNALSCNIYGSDNVALGVQSLGGNTNGFANVGIGNYALAQNQLGNFNIAIGHGAGYYVDKLACNKLFIASHPVDSSFICDNPNGSGLTPLVHGDLSSNQFGINVRELQPSGTLQIGGHITPSSGNIYDIGNSLFSWRDIYLGSLKFANNKSIISSPSGLICDTHIIPAAVSGSNLGSVTVPWSQAYFDNITVNGTATINRFNAYEHCEFFCKTLYLASSGNVDVIDGGGPYSEFDYAYQPELSYNCALLKDEQMYGAGIIASTSGTDYRRDYRFIFIPPSMGVSCSSNGYAKAGWFSNISLVLEPNVFLKANNIVSHDNCNGIYFRNGNTYLSSYNVSNTDLAGLSNFNVLSQANTVSDISTTVASLELGAKVSNRLLTGAKNKVIDPLNNKQVLNGFEFSFVDSSLSSLSTQSDRLVTGSYNNTSHLFNTTVLMKDDSNGIFGINNLGQLSETAIPKTALDIRTTGNAIIRATAENYITSVASLQLLGERSCEYNGFELAYLNTSGIVDLSIYKESGKQVFFRLYDNNSVGLFTSSGTANAMLTLGDNHINNACVSFRNYSGVPSPTQEYGKIFIKPNFNINQSQSIYMLDSSGNTHNLIVNKYDNVDARAIYTDANQNTFGGLYCPSNRNISNNAIGNTAIGHRALSSITSGDFNVVFGTSSASGVTSGLRNIVIGCNSANSITTGQNNIVIGDNVFNLTSNNTSNNIIIGNGGIGQQTSGNYQFLLGASRSVLLLEGSLGPNNSDKQLSMPSGGNFTLYDQTNADALSLRANVLEVKDFTGNDYPDNELTFKFTGNKSANLLSLKHSTSPLNVSPNYDSNSLNRPYAELNGDLRLLGSVRFSDGTSLGSSSQLNVLNSGVNRNANDITTLNNRFNGLFLEGTVSKLIEAPESPYAPTSGTMIVRNNSWNDVANIMLTNRDAGLVVPMNAYVIAISINGEYRPIWVSDQKLSCHR